MTHVATRGQPSLSHGTHPGHVCSCVASVYPENVGLANKDGRQQATGKQGGYWRHHIALCGVREGTAGRGGAAPAAGHTGCAAPGLGEEDLAEMRKRMTMSQRN